MFGKAWRIARIGGIDIRVDTSWLLIAVFISYSFFARMQALYEELSTPEAAALAVAAAFLFFGSVVVHELAHALTSVARGIPVEHITLFLFGGVTSAKVESRGPKEEFLISAVGPLTSAVIAGVLAVVAAALGSPDEAIAGTVGYLAWINGMLAIFNLLPGLPLDGGRVFRAAIWGLTGDLRKATRISATGGRLVGFGLIALGLWSLFFAGGGGLWLVFIGWFLTQAANASYADMELRRSLEGVKAGDVMARDLVTIPPDLAVRDAIEHYLLRQRHSAYPVRAEDGDIIGLLTLAAVREASDEDRRRLAVRDLMMPMGEVATVDAEERVTAMLDLLRDEAGGRVLVREGGRVAGLITPRDIARLLQRSRDLGVERVVDLRRGEEASSIKSG